MEVAVAIVWARERRAEGRRRMREMGEWLVVLMAGVEYVVGTVLVIGSVRKMGMVWCLVVGKEDMVYCCCWCSC